MNKTFLSVIALLLFAAGPLFAQNTKDPYDTALQLLEQAEGAGSEKAAEKMLSDAAALLKKAVEKGNADAMFQLANLYRNGWGVKQNDAETLKLLQLAAGKEHGGALYNLGAYYSAHDPAKSAEFFRRALAQGVPGAGIRFGYCCLRGFGVPKDIPRAKSAFKADAMRGIAAAQNQLGVLLFKENKFFGAEEWFRKAADQNYAAAWNNLGVLERIRGDHAKSLEHFLKAAEKGYLPAMRNLALAYVFTGKDQKAYEQARAWAEKAAAKNDPASLHILGMIHLVGYGCKKDPERAFGYYLKGAEAGYWMSAFQVADMYRKGQGPPADAKKADDWLKKAEALRTRQNDSAKSSLDVTK